MKYLKMKRQQLIEQLEYINRYLEKEFKRIARIQRLELDEKEFIRLDGYLDAIQEVSLEVIL